MKGDSWPRLQAPSSPVGAGGRLGSAAATRQGSCLSRAGGMPSSASVSARTPHPPRRQRFPGGCGAQPQRAHDPDPRHHHAPRRQQSWWRRHSGLGCCGCVGWSQGPFHDDEWRKRWTFSRRHTFDRAKLSKHCLAGGSWQVCKCGRMCVQGSDPWNSVGQPMGIWLEPSIFPRESVSLAEISNSSQVQRSKARTNAHTSQN